MKIIQFGLAICMLGLVLGAAACSRDVTTTAIGRVAITNGLNLYNQPANELGKIAASTPTIYLAAEIVSPTSSTRVRVRWYRLPSLLVSSEDFVGRRDTVNKFDFNRNVRASYLASSIKREGVAWDLGEYRAEVFINGALSKTLFFEVVTDDEAANSKLTAVVQEILTGDTLNSQFKIQDSVSTFSRDSADIYVQTNIRGVETSVDVTIRVRYVKEDRTFATFTYEVIGDEELVIDLERDRFGKLWPDRLWPAGAYEVVVLVGNVLAASHSFLVNP